MKLIDSVAARCMAEEGTRYTQSDNEKLAKLLEDVVSSGPAIRSVREHLRLAGPAPARLNNHLSQIAKWIKDHCDDVVQELTDVENSRDGVTTVSMTVAGTGGAGTAAAVGAVIAGGATSVGPVVSALIATGGIAGPILFCGGVGVYILRKRKTARNKRIIRGASRLSEEILNREKPV